MKEFKYTSWRPDRAHPAPPQPDPVDAEGRGLFPATRFFDQLSYIGDSIVGCFVLETSEGLIQFDCMNPTQFSIDVIEKGYKDLGLDIHDLKAILITHAHGDHYGHANYFRDKYGATIYMSKRDYALCSDPKGRHPIDFEITNYIDDDEVFTLGYTDIHCYVTPGHSPGGLSFIFPVTDEGRPHMVGLWGGTGAPREIDVCKTYLESLDRFSKMGDKYGVDVEIAAHPFVDNGVERLNICRNIVNGVANPFVIGREAYHYYEKMLHDMVVKKMETLR